MLGYNSNHFVGLKPKQNEDELGQFTGHSFSVVAVARCLAGLVIAPEQAVQLNMTEEIWRTWDALETRALQEKALT